MKKASKIIRDLAHLTNYKYFGYYQANNHKYSKNLDIGALSIVKALKPYEINFKALYKVDFDDVVYNDAQGNYELIDLDITSNNSYNWSGQVVFNYNEIKIIDNYGIDNHYITIKFHRYGDVRENYTDYMVLDMSLDEFYNILLECTRVSVEIEYKNTYYTISTDIFKECCVFDIYSSDIDDYDVYLDIDNLRNKKDIKKALIKCLKDNK